jgi:uncharacterized protein with HEPN domain
MEAIFYTIVLITYPAQKFIINLAHHLNQSPIAELYNIRACIHRWYFMIDDLVVWKIIVNSHDMISTDSTKKK